MGLFLTQTKTFATGLTAEVYFPRRWSTYRTTWSFQ